MTPMSAQIRNFPDKILNTYKRTRYWSTILFCQVNGFIFISYEKPSWGVDSPRELLNSCWEILNRAGGQRPRLHLHCVHKAGEGGVDIKPEIKEGSPSPEPGHLLCNRSARWSLSCVWIVWAQHCDPPLAFSVNDHFPEKPETKIDLFTDLEIFVTWAPEPSDCPRRPSRCQPGGLNEMSWKWADC